MEDLVFFKKEGEEGVALTSTSANYIANLAKEYIQSIETRLDNICFYNAEVKLIGESTGNIIQVGTDEIDLSEIPNQLEEVTKCKSLIAWLREAIKAKDILLNHLNDTNLKDWCIDNGIEYPETPSRNRVLTEKEYYASLSVKERNRYYQLETEAAVLGKYIHPDGKLSKERKDIKDKIQNPHKVDGKGRDALIYSYTPSVCIGKVEDLFYELQKKHREVQSQLNAMKHECDLAINESFNKENTRYVLALENHKARLEELSHSFKTWKGEKSKEYSNLKIVIPNHLLGIYNKINSLGK